MTEALSAREVSTAETWDSLVALHGLWQLSIHLKELQTNAMADMLARLRTQPYIAPEGECIMVVPDEETRLVLEVFDYNDDDWHRIITGSETYESLVGFERIYDPCFVGRSVEQDTVDGKIYVYDDSHDVRVLASENARFYQAIDACSE